LVDGVVQFVSETSASVAAAVGVPATNFSVEQVFNILPLMYPTALNVRLSLVLLFLFLPVCLRKRFFNVASSFAAFAIASAGAAAACKAFNSASFSLKSPVHCDNSSGGAGGWPISIAKV
jgi:hypothetical protein